jgi:hypothetical protein
LDPLPIGIPQPSHSHPTATHHHQSYAHSDTTMSKSAGSDPRSTATPPCPSLRVQIPDPQRHHHVQVCGFRSQIHSDTTMSKSAGSDPRSAHRFGGRPGWHELRLATSGQDDQRGERLIRLTEDRHLRGGGIPVGTRGILADTLWDPGGHTVGSRRTHCGILTGT